MHLRWFTIRQKLFLMNLLAIVVVFVYATIFLFDSYHKYHSALSTGKIADFSIKISSVLHELQKERGMSAGFIASRGEKFADLLPKQRQLTDRARQDLDNYMTSLEGENDELKAQIQKIDFSELPNMRTNISQLTLESKVAIDYYTNLNKQLIDLVLGLSVQPTEITTRNALGSFAMFLGIKERAGIERALLSAVFGIDTFETESYAKFLNVIAQQDALLNTMIHVSTPEILALYEEVKKDPSFREAERMRGVALSRHDGFGIDSLYWFKVMTDKIDKLKKIEREIAQNVSQTAKDAVHRALTQLLATFLLSLLFLGILIVITLRYYKLDQRDDTTTSAAYTRSSAREV